MTWLCALRYSLVTARFVMSVGFTPSDSALSTAYFNATSRGVVCAAATPSDTQKKASATPRTGSGPRCFDSIGNTLLPPQRA